MSVFTTYVQLTVVMCVLYPQSPVLFQIFSSRFAADTDELTFLLFDGLSKKFCIAPVFNNTLTITTPKDSASFLYG